MTYFLIIVILLVSDTVVKHWVEKNLEERKRLLALKGKVFFTKFHNKGAALSKGKDKPYVVKWMSLLLTIVFLVLYILTMGRRGEKALKVSLAMILGGALSNTSDRFLRGYVVDYVGFNVKNKRLKNVIYNLSDFYIFIGVVMIAIITLIDEIKGV